MHKLLVFLLQNVSSVYRPTLKTVIPGTTENLLRLAGSELKSHVMGNNCEIADKKLDILEKSSCTSDAKQTTLVHTRIWMVDVFSSIIFRFLIYFST